MTSSQTRLSLLTLRFNATAAPPPLRRRKRLWLLIIILGGLLLLLASCSSTRMILQTAPSKPKGPVATPPITAQTLAAWHAQRDTIIQSFETEVYGALSAGLSLEAISSETLGGVHFDGSAVLHFRQFKVLKDGLDTGREFGLVLVTPAEYSGPTPVIMMQNFCPNHDVIPHPDVPRPETILFSCSGGGVMSKVFKYFFGRYITSPPIKDIMERGYALAIMHPSELIPDSRSSGPTILDDVFSDQPAKTRSGAIAAWAMQFSLISDHLDNDIFLSQKIAYGHSRFGKSALVAAAINPRIDAVIAHQSGTGGASLTRDKPGETLTDITERYPFWFSRSFAGFKDREEELAIDQHHLLALIAPRPIMLGNAKRDVWSDPNGAFRAAQGANPVYKLHGSDGLRQNTLTAFDPEADIAFWLRPGTHGVVKEDWPAFLDFLDSHMK